MAAQVAIHRRPPENWKKFSVFFVLFERLLSNADFVAERFASSIGVVSPLLAVARWDNRCIYFSIDTILWDVCCVNRIMILFVFHPHLDHRAGGSCISLDLTACRCVMRNIIHAMRLDETEFDRNPRHLNMISWQMELATTKKYLYYS